MNRTAVVLFQGLRGAEENFNESDLNQNWSLLLRPDIASLFFTKTISIEAIR